MSSADLVDYGEALESDEWNPEAMDLLEPDQEREIDELNNELEFESDLFEKADRVGTGALPGDAAGATVNSYDSRYGIPRRRNDVVLGEETWGWPEPYRHQVWIHEDGHVLQNTDPAQMDYEMENVGLNDEAREILWEYLESGDENLQEGANEMFALLANPEAVEVAGAFYPFRTALVSDRLMQEGVHPDPELHYQLEQKRNQIFTFLQGDYDEFVEGGVEDPDYLDVYQNLGEIEEAYNINHGGMYARDEKTVEMRDEAFEFYSPDGSVDFKLWDGEYDLDPDGSSVYDAYRETSEEGADPGFGAPEDRYSPGVDTGAGEEPADV